MCQFNSRLFIWCTSLIGGTFVRLPKKSMLRTPVSQSRVLSVISSESGHIERSKSIWTTINQSLLEIEFKPITIGSGIYHRHKSTLLKLAHNMSPISSMTIFFTIFFTNFIRWKYTISVSIRRLISDPKYRVKTKLWVLMDYIHI